MWKQNLHREKNCKTASWTLEENKYFPDLCITVTNIRTGLDCYCLLPGELWWRSSKKLLYKDPGDNEPRWWLGETLWKAFDSTYQVSEQHSHCPTDTWGGNQKTNWSSLCYYMKSDNTCQIHPRRGRSHHSHSRSHHKVSGNILWCQAENLQVTK